MESSLGVVHPFESVHCHTSRLFKASISQLSILIQSRTISFLLSVKMTLTNCMTVHLLFYKYMLNIFKNILRKLHIPLGVVVSGFLFSSFSHFTIQSPLDARGIAAGTLYLNEVWSRPVVFS